MHLVRWLKTTTSSPCPSPPKDERNGARSVSTEMRLSTREHWRDCRVRSGPLRVLRRCLHLLSPSSHPVINRIIDFSVRNRVWCSADGALCVAGWWSMRHMPLDAIPDLSDTQVIIYSRWDRSPDLVEAQVTYPIITAMLGAPRVKSVRGFSDFGYSYRLSHLRRGHGHVLGAGAHAGISVGGGAAPAAGRADRDGAGRHRAGLGLSICAGG